MSADGAAGSSGGGADDLSGDEQRGPVVASAVSGGGCLVFEPADVLRLRAEHRLVGRLVGSVPPSRRPKKKRRQGHDPEPHVAERVVVPAENLFQKGSSKSGAGLPLFLSADETALALAESLLLLVPSTDSGGDDPVRDQRTPLSPPPPLLHDLWKRGFYVTAATKFGGEWLCYRADPLCVHADYIVSCWPRDAPCASATTTAAAGCSQSIIPPGSPAGLAAALGSIGVTISVEHMYAGSLAPAAATASAAAATAATATTPSAAAENEADVLAASAAVPVARGSAGSGTDGGGDGVSASPPLCTGAAIVARLRVAAQAKKVLVLAVEQQHPQAGAPSPCYQEGQLERKQPAARTATAFTYYRLEREART